MHHPYLAALLLSSARRPPPNASSIRPVRRKRRIRSGGPSQQGVRVEAVLRSRERDLAIVNGKIVRAGDRVSGVQIEAILVDAVRYVRDGQVHIARLQPDFDTGAPMNTFLRMVRVCGRAWFAMPTVGAAQRTGAALRRERR